MKEKDERIAKPGIRGSVIFILIFILVLIWFGVSEEDPESVGAIDAAAPATGTNALLVPDYPLYC